MNAITDFFTAPVADLPVWFFMILIGTLCYYIWKAQELEAKYDQLQANVRRTIKRDTIHVTEPDELDRILNKYEGIWEGIK